MTKTQHILSTLASYEACEVFCRDKNPRRVDKNTIVRIAPEAAEVVHHGIQILALYRDRLPMFKAWPSQSTIRRQNAILPGVPLHMKQGIVHYCGESLSNHSWYSLDLWFYR